MGKNDNTVETIINEFDLGMHQDPRVKNTRYARIIKGFDSHTYPFKLVPFRSSVTADALAATNKIQNFVVARYAANDYRTFGLGVVSGGTKAKVFVNNSIFSTTWSALTNGASSSGTATDFELFVYYAKTGRIYGARDGTTIWKCDPADSAAFADDLTLNTAYSNPRSSSASNRPNISGLVHSKDDILYIGYDNIIIKNNNGSWTDPALTFPTNRIITSLSEYGNYLAIATKSVDQVGNSVVYLWDRDSSITTLTGSIDWGEGNLQILEQINGVLVGISITGTTGSVLYSRITFRYYAGGSPVVFKQFVSEAVDLANYLPRAKRKVNDYLYFLLTIKINGTTHQGLWKLGKHISSGEFVVTMDRTPNNDTDLTSGELHNFIVNGDIATIAYTDNGSLAMSVTDSSTNFNSNSVYESVILGNQRQKYKLISVGVMTEPMPAAGSITLKYKADSETSYTTVFTNTGVTAGSFLIGTDYTIQSVGSTDFTAIGASANTAGLVFTATGVGTGTGKAINNPIYHEAVNIESNGNDLPEFREISFQIISTGNAVITGLRCKYEKINSNLTD